MPRERQLSNGTFIGMKKSRINLAISLSLLALSGIALYVLAPTDEGLPHPYNGLLREIHGAGAVVGLIMFGYLFADHVKKKLIKYRKIKTHRPWDGYVHLWLWIFLIITGWLLYYPQEAWLGAGTAVASAHWYAGVFLMVLFPLHTGRKYWSERGKK